MIIFDGNSLTAGLGASPGNSYPEQVMRLLPRSYTARNAAVSAQTTTDMAADAATQIDPLAKSNVHPILIVWEGTNDIYFGASPAEAYEHLARYCRDRRAAGYRVMILTVLPRSEAGAPANFEQSRQDLNVRIRANWSSFSDGIVDVAADNHIGEQGDDLDPRFYTDRVHLTDAGYAIVATLVASQIDHW